MEQYKEGQYDDDLTVGIDEYDEDFDTGGVDLFDYLEDADSPLARLKSIILSIDWEITDDILRQFNEELHDLRDIWADNKINVIYVQALEKLSRYIYKEKSSAHPSAIKLLLTFYANLEKIVSDEELTDQEKKTLLRADVARFENFKRQIVPAASPVSTPVTTAVKETPAPVPVEDRPVEVHQPVHEDLVAGASMAVERGDSVAAEDDPLLNLKAIVYGIDWEITEQDLAELSREVKHLEKTFSSSKAKQIFLQGIGSLGAYIKLKKSDAHADAFKLLHSFFLGLEAVVRQGLTGQAEKDILFPEVEKFNKFKAIIAGTISSDAIAKTAAADEDEEDYSEAEIQPAFADVPEDVHGFQEEQEAALLAEKESQDQNTVVDEYFDDDEEGTQPEQVDPGIAGEMESRLEGLFEEPGKEVTRELDAETALQGVDVETDADDDSDEEPLLVEDGEFAPALAIEDQPEEDSPAVFADKIDDFFDDSEEPDISTKALPGVDVEHEADDDLEEELLPFVGGEYAPALTGSDDEEHLEKSAFGDESEIQGGLDDFFGKESEEEAVETFAAGDVAEPGTDIPAEDTVAPEAADIEDRLTDFFGESEPELLSDSADEALKGVEVETVEDDESGEEPLPFHGGEIAPALSSKDDDETPEDEEELVSQGEDDDQLFTSVEEGEDLLAGEELAADDDSDGFSELFGDGTETEDEPGEETEVLRGVDVETPDDDDSEEEALPFEDGELAPALATDDGSAAVFSDDADDEAATDISNRFDSFFGTEDAETEKELDPVAFQMSEEDEEDLDSAEFRAAEEAEEEQLDAAAFELIEEPAEEDEFKTERADEQLAFDEELFQELSGDEIEEFPTEAFGGTDEEKEDEEILALLGDDGADTDLFKEELEDELAPAFSDYPEDSIPEVAAEELEAVLDEEDSVIAAGEIPSGYPSSDELLARFGEVAGDEDLITHPEGNEDFIIAVEDPHVAESLEDEVVFTAVEEEEELGEMISFKEEGEEEKDYDKADSFGTTLLANGPFVERKPLVADTVAKKVVEDQPVKEIEEEESAYVLHQEGMPSSDVLQSLRNCIVSLGLEIDDAILDGLNEEITKLRHSWLDKPAERTFVQLLSTVTAHIERYRYDADAEANRLLLSIFDKLELCVMGQANSNEIQEAVLNETSKVLQWQARLIDRTSPQKEESVRPRQEVAEAHAQEHDFAAVQPQAPLGTGLDEMSKKVDEIGNDLMMQKVSSIMKAELDQLKAAFHAELKELKEEILRGRRRE